MYDQIVDHLHDNIEKKDPIKGSQAVKGQRPLKMPKGYDFSVRNVNWDDYKKDYILRTDAVWEKSKLLDMFQSHYKSQFSYDEVNNRYMVANIR